MWFQKQNRHDRLATPGNENRSGLAYDLRWVEQMAGLANGACLPENKIGHVDVKYPRMAQLSRGRR
jgi:hypothetical protein